MILTPPISRIWNEYVDFVGMSTDPGHVDHGNLGQIDVEHENQGVYSLFSANDDAICVAWVTTTWSEERGGNKYAVSGDFGRECGGIWYASGMYPSSETDYQPDCFWIDANGDQPQTGFQVRWPAFSGQEWDKNDTDPQRFCNGVDFGLRDEPDPNTITYLTRSGVVGNKVAGSGRRTGAALRRRTSWAAEELVVSDSKSHSAQRLCESDTSMGPDFAHESEGLFCDMGTKTLYDYCTEETDGPCFDSNIQALSTNKRGASRVRSAVVPYKRVRDWRGGTKGRRAA